MARSGDRVPHPFCRQTTLWGLNPGPFPRNRPSPGQIPAGAAPVGGPSLSKDPPPPRGGLSGAWGTGRRRRRPLRFRLPVKCPQGPPPWAARLFRRTRLPPGRFVRGLGDGPPKAAAPTVSPPGQVPVGTVPLGGPSLPEDPPPPGGPFLGGALHIFHKK